MSLSGMTSEKLPQSKFFETMVADVEPAESHQHQNVFATFEHNVAGKSDHEE